MTEELLKELLTTVRDTKAFVLSEAPSVIQEFLAWEFYSSLILAALATIALGVLFRVFVWIHKRIKNGERGADSVDYLIPTLVSMSVIALFLCSLSTAVKVKVAPKVVLLEKLSELTQVRR